MISLSKQLKPKKIFIVYMIEEGMDFSVVARAFRYKSEAKAFCDFYNEVCENRCYHFEETMLYE